MGTQIDDHRGEEGAEAGLPVEGSQGSHWGRALRMAFTSSATAVRANSNWSWGRAVGGRRVTGRLGLCSCLRGLLGVGVGEVTWERGSPPGGGIQAGCCWFP